MGTVDIGGLELPKPLTLRKTSSFILAPRHFGLLQKEIFMARVAVPIVASH